MTTTDTIPADARILPDDTERQKHIASLVFDMDDELGQTKRLIGGAMLSLEAVTMRPIEKLRAKEICSLMDGESAGVVIGDRVFASREFKDPRGVTGYEVARVAPMSDAALRATMSGVPRHA